MIDLDRFWRGDPAYYQTIVQTRGPLALGVARAYAVDADHADDLIQDIWKRVFEKRRSYRGRGSFEAWLHRLANNVCITDFRRRMERRKAHERAAQEGVPIGSDLAGEPWHLETGSVARNRKLHMALTCLSPRQHQAIWLRLFEERESEDVAVIMGVKRATVRSNIRHGVKRLKELMEVPEDELSRYQRSG